MSEIVEKMFKDQREEANKLRKTSDFANVCFKTDGDGRVKADKNYLCTFHWRYSQTLMRNGSMHVINLTESNLKIQTSEMEKIIDFIYTGEFHFNQYTFNEIIHFHKISAHLMIQSFEQYLEKYILENYQINFNENSLRLWNYALEHSKELWEKNVLKSISNNIKEFLKHNNLLLKPSQYKVLYNANLRLDDDTKCRFLLEWLDHDKKERYFYFSELFERIDVGCLREETLEILLERGDSVSNNVILTHALKSIKSKKSLVPINWDSFSSTE